MSRRRPVAAQGAQACFAFDLHTNLRGLLGYLVPGCSRTSGCRLISEARSMLRATLICALGFQCNGCIMESVAARVTLEHVAREAYVSIPTVDRAINGRPATRQSYSALSC